jgi:hypothetical protein
LFLRRRRAAPFGRGASRGSSSGALGASRGPGALFGTSSGVVFGMRRLFGRRGAGAAAVGSAGAASG